MSSRKNSVLKSIQIGLHRLEDGIILFLLAAMLILAASQIIMRELFSSGAAWIDPLLRIAVLWLGLFGALLATRSNRHIEIDLFTHLTSGRLKATIGLITTLFAASVCGVIAYQAVRFVQDEIEYASTVFSNLPVWPFESVIPITFGLISLRYLTVALNHCKKLISGKT